MSITEQYIFLGGHRKCGTTMLLNLFDGHPLCCVYPSDISVLYGYFPKYIIEEHSVEDRLARLDLVVFGSLKRLCNKRGLDQRLAVEQMRDHFFDNIDHAALDQIDVIIRQIIDSYRFVTDQPVQEKPIVLVKETSLEIYAQELAEPFPGCQFITLLRDPRDNYGALRAGVDKHYSKFGEKDKHILASLIHRAGISMQLLKANQQVMGDGRFLPVSFEKLTTDINNVMTDVARFAGIRWDDCLLRPTVMGQETTGNNYDDEKFREVTNKNVDRWRERISEFEAKVIEFHLGDIMQQFGYNLEYSLLETARAASEFYKWTNNQYFYKDSFAALC